MKIGVGQIMIILLVLSIHSCQENNSAEIDSNYEEIVEMDTSGSALIQEELIDAIASDSSNNKEIFLEDMPSNFLKLTEGKETGLADAEDWVIYKWCFAELPQIWIESQKGDDWILTFAYGQDSEQWYIKNFKAHQSERELYLVVDGTFELVPLSPNYSDGGTVNFWWNKDIGFAGFDFFYDTEAFFVPEKDREMYQELREECEYDEY